MATFRNIPKVDRILELAAAKNLLINYPRPVVLKAVRMVLDNIRYRIREGTIAPDEFTESCITDRVLAELASNSRPNLCRVINGTGIVIHTNLGRSPLPEAVQQQLFDIAFRYSNLEYDTVSGERGDRYEHVEPLICELTGAESALVVNNNAAALLLALTVLTAGKEVIVSRGELVEIGGSFRIPEIMEQSGAILREVGTTNRTHLGDYKKAIQEDTALFLKVSCSNYKIVGYTSEVSAGELAELGVDTGIPVMVDAGSGLFVDLESLIGHSETTVRDYLKDGVDLVVCSGDKLLGGPQIGIIAGKRAIVEPMKRHPLLRALRVDKMTLATLEGVLRLYCDDREAIARIPTLRMLTAPAAKLDARAARIITRLRRELPDAVKLEKMKGISMAGGGAMPQLELPGVLLSVTSSKYSVNEIDEKFRGASTPVIGRIAKGKFLLDVRTIFDDDLPLLEGAFRLLS